MSELFDSRVVQRNIKRNLITKEDYQKHLESLEDCSDLLEDMETKFMRKVQKEQQIQEEK
jgi:hypothetical protein